MALQIFGINNSFDTKKTERFFKERNISFQFIDLSKYPIAPREYESIRKNFKALDEMVDKKSPLYKKLFIEHLAYESEVEEKLFQNPTLFILPIVRFGQKATVGLNLNKWEEWIKEIKEK